MKPPKCSLFQRNDSRPSNPELELIFKTGAANPRLGARAAPRPPAVRELRCCRAALAQDGWKKREREREREVKRRAGERKRRM